MNKQHIIASKKAASDINQPSIQIGISACLAGNKVRYNGGHRQSRLCLDLLSQCFMFTTFCPEEEAGFGTPRPTMRLIGDPASPQLAFSNDSTSDLTAQLVHGFKKSYLK